ncbi:phosphodiester glycosidase family protein [Palleronia sp. LCG004]|uniref:phosphodiester glycosidase family protein n=1 Tax=Palleronia sp. LCG004 TaxID=3079304 RepID=UPI00397AF118
MLRLAAMLAALALPGWASGGDCETTRFDGARFTVCEVDLRTETLRLWLGDADGTPYGSFSALDRALSTRGERLGVAMNAGMYHADRSPVGLFVEEGEERRGIVTREGPGNFGLLPNGVLCFGEDRARIIESRRFAETRPDCRFATQSGPMLVIGGDLHPRFLPDSTSIYVRNGAGVSEDGHKLWLVISEDRVNFDLFGRFFRDGLGLRDALYFDGNISRLYDAGTGRNDFGRPMGPIIGTVSEAG